MLQAINLLPMWFSGLNGDALIYCLYVHIGVWFFFFKIFLFVYLGVVNGNSEG